MFHKIRNFRSILSRLLNFRYYYSMDLIGVLTLTFFLKTPIGRFIFFLLGAILVLGPSNLTAAKIIYLVVLVFARFLSLGHIKNILDKGEYLSKIRILEVALLLSFSFPFLISILSGNSLLFTFRSLLPILLTFLSLPVIFDAAYSSPKNSISFIILVCGIISAVSVWFVWSQNRGLNDFSTSRFAFDADWVAFLAYIIALAEKHESTRMIMLSWLAKITIPVFLILSFSRTNIVLLLFITIFSILSSKIALRTIVVNFLIIASSVFILINFFRINQNYVFVSRITRTWQMLREGGLSNSGLGADLSITYRRQQAEFAKSLWHNNLISGTGTLPQGLSFDTIWGTIAQFGILGLIILLLTLSLFFVKSLFMLTSGRQIIIPFFVLMIPATAIYNWPANKSFWLALSCYLAISLKVSCRNQLVYK